MITAKKTDIENWLFYMGIDLSCVTLHADYSVDVNSDVNLYNKNLTRFPIQFGIVKGNFNCAENRLTSLAGAPREVDGYFDCSRNQLTSLAYSPKKIKLDLNTSKNKITSLDYCPEDIGDYFYIEDNPLEIIHTAYLPHTVGKKIYLPVNEKLKIIFEHFYDGTDLGMTLEQLVSCYRHYELESQLPVGGSDSKLKL